MVITNNLKISFLSALLYFASSNFVDASNIDMNTAQMQALDKVTGQMKVIDIPVGGEARFGSFSIVVRSCKTTPPEDVPENYAFIDVADTNNEGKIYNIFKGWMVSSSPSLNSVEHPVYDVWLLKCINSNDNNLLLTQQQLDERDNLEKLSTEVLSKEAKIAIEIQEEQALKEKELKQMQEEQERLLAEEKEAKSRLNEINTELESQLVVVPSSQDSIEDEGPEALFRINQVVMSPETDTKSYEIENNTDNKKTESISNIDELPEDIDEVIPQVQ